MSEQSSYQDLIENAVMESPAFLRLVFSGTSGKETPAWQKASFRPVQIKDKRCIQVSYETGAQRQTFNLEGAELLKRVRECLALPFSNIHLQQSTGDIHIRITRKGKVLMSKAAPS